MASTVSYSASLCTRHYNSSSNAKNGYASQEFYDSSYNNVGIISFVGMNLANKVITSIWLDIDASKAGYGAGSTKTVFMRKANYQNGIASGIAGWQYTGDELGTFDGSFYGNYTSYYITGSLTSPGRCSMPWRHILLRATTALRFITHIPARRPRGIPTIIFSGQA